MGVVFGSGVFGSLFGVIGLVNFLSWIMGVFVVVFFVISLILVYVVLNQLKMIGSVMQEMV